MSVQFQIRRDTASNWSSANPILAEGEFAYETDTGLLKIGNGSDNYNSLPYINPENPVVENSITSTELAVVNNGVLGQVLASDGDGTFQWVDNGAYYIQDEPDYPLEQNILMTRKDLGSDLIAYVDSETLTYSPINQTLYVRGQIESTLQGSVLGDDSNVLIDSAVGKIELDGTIKGNLVPDSDIAYDLGTATNRFRDLYLSGSTVDLAGTQLSIDSNGDLLVSDATARKRVIAGEIEIGDEIGTIRLKRDSATGTMTFESIDPTTGDVIGNAKTDLSQSTTDDLAEGDSNKYFSDSLARSAISATGDLSYNSATGEISFTERTDSQVRGLLSATGDLSYNSSTGEISFTERTDSQVRGLLSAGGDLSYDSGTGEFSVTTYKSTDFDTDFGNKSTDNLTEGSSNQYYADSLVDSHLSGGTGVSYSQGVISIGQSVGNGDSVQFSSVSITSEPTANNDAATKNYVDQIATGLSTLPSADAATTENLSATFSAGTLTATANEALVIDGVTLELGDNVVVKDQTNANENGSYVVSQTGDVSNPWILERCDFCNEADEIAGAFEFVTNGTTNANTGWVFTVADPQTFVINTDDVTVIQFSGGGESYLAGTGLSLTGNTFNNTGVLSVDSKTGAVSSADIMTAVQKEHGVGSGLDADLLDGQEGAHYLDYNNFANTPSIPAAANNATVSLSAGNGLSGGGSFSVDQATNSTISFAIAANSVGADELDVASNGTAGQVLSSDGDGSFSWIDAATGGGTSLTVSNIDGSATITNSVSNVAAIRFDVDTGFLVEDLGNSEVKVSLGSTFKTWQVNGQTDLVAVGEDTMEFIAGTGIEITTDPNSTPQSITFSNTQTSAEWGNITGTLSTQTDLQNALDAKQDSLVSGTNIKTVNSVSLLGSGDVDLSTNLTLNGTDLEYTNIDGALQTIDLSAFLDDSTNTVVSGTLSGNSITFTREDASTFSVDVAALYDDTNLVTSVNGDTGAITVQETLVSGTNIKTLNGESLLGSGDITAGSPLVESPTGTFTLTGDLVVTGDVTSQSDRRLKSNINPLENSLDSVKKLQGVSFDKDGARHIGLIAQEVERVLPEVVATADDELGTKSVAYGNLVSVLIEAVKELSTEIEELKRGV